MMVFFSFPERNERVKSSIKWERECLSSLGYLKVKFCVTVNAVIAPFLFLFFFSLQVDCAIGLRPNPHGSCIYLYRFEFNHEDIIIEREYKRLKASPCNQKNKKTLDHQPQKPSPTHATRPKGLFSYRNGRHRNSFS